MTNHDSEERAPMKFRDLASRIPPAEGLMQIIEPGWRSNDAASADRTNMTPEEQGDKTASEEREAIVAYLEKRSDYWKELVKQRPGDGKKNYERRMNYSAALREEAREIRDGAHHEGER